MKKKDDYISVYRVKEVKPLPDYILFIRFMDGARKNYDVKPLFSKRKAFKDLQNIKGLFEQVKVDMDGYGITWNDYVSLSCDELYYDGVISACF